MGSEARKIGVESPWGRNGVRIFFSQLRHLIPFLPRSLSSLFMCPFCVLPDAGGWGAEGRAPESAGWDHGNIVGRPRVRWFLLCCMEDGEAAATTTGLVTRQAAAHPGLEVGDSGEGLKYQKPTFSPWGLVSASARSYSPVFTLHLDSSPDSKQAEDTLSEAGPSRE